MKKGVNSSELGVVKVSISDIENLLTKQNKKLLSIIIINIIIIDKNFYKNK